MHNPLSPMTYLRRQLYPRSPYEQPIQPLQLVICLVVGVVGAVVAAVVYVMCTLISFLFRLAFRRR